MRRYLAQLVAVVLLVGACAPGSPSPTGGASPADLARADIARAVADPSGAAIAARALNAFAMDLHRVAVSGPDNLVTSPASVALALAMARAGARGETAAEIDRVLRDLGSDGMAAAVNALDAALGSRSGTFRDDAGQSLEVALRIANASFAQDGLAISSAYLEALASRFGAGVRLVDYRAAPEVARTAINAWVAAQTEDRIRELLAQGVISQDTRLTLVNAVYLKAPWLEAFSEEATAPAPFTRLDGTTVEAPMMRRTDGMRYAAGSDWQVVEIPYIGGSLAMTVILPADLPSFEADLNGDRLASLVEALKPRTVELGLPRFSVESSLGLGEALGVLGMPLAFDPSLADFSGITTQEQLFISAVIHQANIDVDERGTEAAAATAVVMDTTSAPSDPVTLMVDRPFLFLVRDVPTGAIVFMGRVMDPGAA